MNKDLLAVLITGVFTLAIASASTATADCQKLAAESALAISKLNSEAVHMKIDAIKEIKTIAQDGSYPNNSHTQFEVSVGPSTESNTTLSVKVKTTEDTEFSACSVESIEMQKLFY